MTKDPNELCCEYLFEVERLYGKDRANKSIADYDKGWFRVSIARKYSDGSIGNASMFANNIRRKEFERMIAELKKRAET